MNNKAIFTICAKNYLAQALTLKESTLKNNNDVDFYLVLADQTSHEIEDVETELLSTEWCPDWESMAFKYNVIEFSTSVKPFYFDYLFKKGYEKVVYLDPDIYVVDKLDVVFEALNDKSIVLTPHYCDIVEEFNGAVSESTFMNDGVFNLGFCAIKNNNTGVEIVKWWKNRLHTKCYSQPNEGYFTDQKWMDFIPAFFPNDVCATHHFGLNNAIWNLHERSLIYENGKYFVRRKKNEELYPLIFFHFSGFDPFNKEVINRRHADYNIHVYPSFKPIIEEYRKMIYNNGFDKYHNLLYSLNYFSDGTPVTPLHRRLYRVYIEQGGSKLSPFSIESEFYNLLKRKGLLLKAGNSKEGLKKTYSSQELSKAHRIENKIIFPLLRMFYKLLGYKKYTMLVDLSKKISLLEYHSFLLK